LTTARFPIDAAPSPGGRSAAEGLAAAAIPVLRPLLPDADRLLPYLRRIDANRTYSNFGPLACEFEDRIAALLAQGPGTVVSASSAPAEEHRGVAEVDPAAAVGGVVRRDGLRPGSGVAGGLFQLWRARV
jgi:hypothetical protein